MEHWGLAFSAAPPAARGAHWHRTPAVQRCSAEPLPAGILPPANSPESCNGTCSRRPRATTVRSACSLLPRARAVALDSDTVRVLRCGGTGQSDTVRVLRCPARSCGVPSAVHTPGSRRGLHRQPRVPGPGGSGVALQPRPRAIARPPQPAVRTSERSRKRFRKMNAMLSQLTA